MVQINDAENVECVLKIHKFFVIFYIICLVWHNFSTKKSYEMWEYKDQDEWIHEIFMWNLNDNLCLSCHGKIVEKTWYEVQIF